VFRLSPSLRRSAAYWGSGWFLVTGLVVALYLAGHVPGVSGALSLAPLFFGPAVLAWSYRVRVDDRGIWRRRFFGRDLWAWEAFATGAVREGAVPYGWVHSGKPWYRRKLNFQHLADADRDWLMDRVRQVWVPPVPRLPEQVTIRFPAGISRFLELSPRGIVVWQERDDHARHYRWSDVGQLRVTRFAHWRRDFTALDVELPEGEPVERLRGRPDHERNNWEGADPEVVLAYFLQHVPRERTRFTALTGPPRTQDEADRRLLDLERSYREARAVGLFVCGLMLFLCFLLLFQGPGALHWDGYQWLAAGLFALALGLFAVPFLLIVFAARRLRARRRQEITSWCEQRRASTSSVPRE
jgi:hypothetical protein